MSCYPSVRRLRFLRSCRSAAHQDIHDRLGEVVLSHAQSGYNSSVFAYGQTGSGKTHTMLGTDADPGLIPRICEGLFTKCEGWNVEVSFFEIYNEVVIDLLNPAQIDPLWAAHGGAAGLVDASGKPLSPTQRQGPPKQEWTTQSAPRKPPPIKGLTVREHKKLGVYVDGLVKSTVSSAVDISELLLQGASLRAVAATNMNSQSSRSHAIVQIHLAEGSTGDRVSQLNLVDLAGSENAARAGSAGARIAEGRAINRSLLCLGQCIAVLASAESTPRKTPSKQRVPYRDSVLTWILKEALGGNAHTLMLCALSVSRDDYEQTLSTLRYADQAKKIQTYAVVNEDATKRMVRELQDEVARLTSELRSNVNVVAEPTDGQESLPAMTPRERQMEELTKNLEIIDVLKMSKEDKVR